MKALFSARSADGWQSLANPNPPVGVQEPSGCGHLSRLRARSSRALDDLRLRDRSRAAYKQPRASPGNMAPIPATAPLVNPGNRSRPYPDGGTGLKTPELEPDLAAAGTRAAPRRPEPPADPSILCRNTRPGARLATSQPGRISVVWRLSGILATIVSHLGAHWLGGTCGRWRENRPPSGAVRLRVALERLGPTFIKLGQVLLLPSSRLCQGQCNTSCGPFLTTPLRFPMPLSTPPKCGPPTGARSKRSSPAFSPQPIASASISQVHLAVLQALRGGKGQAAGHRWRSGA